MWSSSLSRAQHSTALLQLHGELGAARCKDGVITHWVCACFGDGNVKGAGIAPAPWKSPSLDITIPRELIPQHYTWTQVKNQGCALVDELPSFHPLQSFGVRLTLKC